jgi:GntR family transcriptional regulator/MocR family aminotransferase
MYPTPRRPPGAGKLASNLLIRIDPRARESLQGQIYSAYRRAILEGVLRPGARVPSSRDLAADLGVSRTTTQLALEQLIAEGYLRARRGSGTFVAEEVAEDLSAGELDSAAEPRHPPLSRRGLALAATMPAAVRIAGPPRPFRIGVPALELFPVRTWSKLMNRALRSVSLSKLDYGDAQGLLPLREAIAEHLRVARGAQCEAEQVFVVAGAQRGLDLACHLLLDHGDRAWMENPGYPGAWKALTAAGAEIVPVPVDDEGLDVEAGSRSAGRACLVYVSPSHQFPLGVPMSLSRRLALLNWAASAGAWVVEDDYDSEFRYGARPLPCLQGLDRDGRVIYVGSFAKTLFPSLRLGFVIVPPDLAEAILRARRASELHPPTLDQAALADFLAEGHFARHIRRMRSAYGERLLALEEAARRHCAGALRLRPARTGLHAVADLKSADARVVFTEAAERGVEVMPLAAYTLGPDKPPNGLVLGFGAVPPDRLGEGMELLAAAIEAAERSGGRT